MVEFDLWKESFIFFIVFSTITLIPCIIMAFLGVRIIKKASYWPSRVAFIFISWEFLLYLFVGSVSIFLLYCSYLILVS